MQPAAALHLSVNFNCKMTWIYSFIFNMQTTKTKRSPESGWQLKKLLKYFLFFGRGKKKRKETASKGDLVVQAFRILFGILYLFSANWLGQAWILWKVVVNKWEILLSIIFIFIFLWDIVALRLVTLTPNSKAFKIEH